MRKTMVRRHLPLVYVALVTALLLALVAEQARRGPSGLPSVIVLSMAAGFGLEFVRWGWTAETRSTGDEHSPRG